MSLDAAVLLNRDRLTIDVSLQASAGETVAVLGPNGAGKTSLLEALAGLSPIDGGRISLDGVTLDEPETNTFLAAESRGCGIAFQDGRLLPHRTALDNVAYPLRASGSSRTDARRRAAEMLERLGAGHLAASSPGRLSGGEAKRVVLARALLAARRMLLLDEPLSAADVRSRRELRSVLARELAAYEGVRILVTHDPIEAMTLAERLIVVEEGRVTHAGTPEEVRTSPKTPYAAELVGVNLFTGRLVPLGDGLARLETTRGSVWIATDVPAVEVATAVLSPADVSLFPAQPAGSARNVLEAVVAGVSFEGSRARIALDAAPPLIAEVTAASTRALGLEAGSRVWASFKAVEVRLVE